MMNNYPGLTKLRTKMINYQDVIMASDSCTLEQLKELTSKRKAIEESINENSHVTEAIAREMSGGLTSRCQQDIQKLEIYLPLLANLVHHINMKGKNQKMNLWISNLRIRWSSVLTSSSIFHSPKFYQINDMSFELAMTLFLYGAMLRERALEVLSSDLVQSATLFRKAAGVYNYLAQKVLTNLNRSQEKQPEAMCRVSSIMSLVCLADAQLPLYYENTFQAESQFRRVTYTLGLKEAVTARKAEEDGKTSGLLAKLHYGITEFLVEAIDILQVVNKECKDISPRFLDFITSCKILHELKSYKYLVRGLNNDGKIGVAIGVLRRALANSKKVVPKEESWRLVFKQVVNDLTVLLQKYEHENEFVWREKVPRNEELPLPQSVKIVSIIPYEPQKWERTLVFKL